MKFLPLFTLTIDAGAPVEVGPGPFGTRLISTTAGGRFEGPRLRGSVLRGGGDWILADGEGVWHMDVRLALETDDGARIFLQYHGSIVMTGEIVTALRNGGSTDYGDSYFMTQPRFETGAPAYRWLNRLVAVGQGRLGPGIVQYEIFEVAHDND